MWLMLILVSGCGGGGTHKEAVSGSVTWKGQPLYQGTIEFVPADGQRIPVSGSIQNGRYHLLSRPGVAPGSYQVRISSREGPMRRGNPNTAPDADLLDPKAKERIAPKYNVKSELKAEVKKGGDNTFDFRLD
jgi:hypothetical protein